MKTTCWNHMYIIMSIAHAPCLLLKLWFVESTVHGDLWSSLYWLRMIHTGGLPIFFVFWICYYRLQTKLWEGNVFIRVCPSVSQSAHQEVPMWPLGMMPWTSLYRDPSTPWISHLGPPGHQTQYRDRTNCGNQSESRIYYCLYGADNEVPL